MFGKTLIAASAVFSLVSATAAFAETAKPVSATSVAKIQDLSRAHAKLDYRKKSKIDSATGIALGGGLLIGGGVCAALCTSNSNP